MSRGGFLPLLVAAAARQAAGAAAHVVCATAKLDHRNLVALEASAPAAAAARAGGRAAGAGFQVD